MKATKINIPTGNTGASSIPPIEDSFIYIETSSNVFGPAVFDKIERTFVFHFSKSIFYYNGFQRQLTIHQLVWED